MHILGALGPPDFFNQTITSWNPVISMTTSPCGGKACDFEILILMSGLRYGIQMLLERKMAIPHNERSRRGVSTISGLTLFRCAALLITLHLRP